MKFIIFNFLNINNWETFKNEITEKKMVEKINIKVLNKRELINYLFIKRFTNE